jgi:glycerol kinase
MLAGSAVGLYGWDLSKPATFARVNSQGNSKFKPVMHTESRETRWKMWKRAVERSKGWDQNKEE